MIDYIEEFENWLRSEGMLFYGQFIGISIYTMDLDKNLFGHQFNLITSKPKNFQINSISTSRNDLNAIEAYMLLVKQINTTKYIKNINKNKKEIFIKNTYDNVCKNDKSNFYFNQFSQQCILTVRPVKQEWRIFGGKYVVSIVYINKNSHKALLVSLSLKEDLKKCNFKVLLENIYNNFINDGAKFVKLKNQFMSVNVKSINESFYYNSQMKTSLVFFTDITNSTDLINDYPREGLFIIRRLIEKLAETVEKHGLLINEIPGDGLLYSIGFGKFINKSLQHQAINKLSFLEAYLQILYKVYNKEKIKILQEFKESYEYKSNSSFYINFENLLKRNYLKTVLFIDNISFIPLDLISFKQYILYGSKLWDISKFFKTFEEEKNKNDIIVFHESVYSYFEAFLFKNKKKITINEKDVCILTYPKK